VPTKIDSKTFGLLANWHRQEVGSNHLEYDHREGPQLDRHTKRVPRPKKKSMEMKKLIHKFEIKCDNPGLQFNINNL